MGLFLRKGDRRMCTCTLENSGTGGCGRGQSPVRVHWSGLELGVIPGADYLPSLPSHLMGQHGRTGDFTQYQ